MTPKMPLADLAQGEDPPRTIAAGESMVWSKELGEMAQALEERGMKLWPGTRLMSLDNPLTERLVASGRLGVMVVNVFRRLTFWRLVVMMVDGRGRRRKVEVRSEPPWVEVQEDES